MDFKLIPPRRSVAQLVCASIHDRVQHNTLDAVVKELAGDLLERPLAGHAQAMFTNDLRAVLGKQEHTKMVETWIRSCYPLALRDDPVGEPVALFAKGNQASDCIAAFLASYYLGQKFGEDFADWWNEWNGELDQAFWEWLYELEFDVYYDETGAPSCM